SGSTAYITKAIAEADEPTTFAIGTEINLVQRLAAEHPQHTIFCLDPVICPCSTMYRIHPGYIAWVLESLIDGEVVNQISVDDSVADPARESLTRMLAAKPRVCARGTRHHHRLRHRRADRGAAAGRSSCHHAGDQGRPRRVEHRLGPGRDRRGHRDRGHGRLKSRRQPRHHDQPWRRVRVIHTLIIWQLRL